MTPSSSLTPLPHRFTRRPYQEEVAGDILAGRIRRAVKVWHRRAGKDKDDWNLMIEAAGNPACPIFRVGTYFYVFPTYTQGKKVIWDGIDGDGMRVRDHIPPDLIVGKPNDTEMKIRLTTGSVIQIVGSDNIDSLMGTNPVGVVFSEYSLQNPDAWDYLRPVLRENGGWAIFNGTPRGHNHLYRLFMMATNNPDWLASKLDWRQTGVLTEADIEAERASGMSDDLIAQEFGVDFEVANQGSYYGRLMAQARAGGRVGLVPYDPTLKVHTVMDIGVSDYTSIGFVQVKGNAVFGIDYYANNGEGFQHYARILDGKHEKLGYRYGVHVAPHDAGQRSKNDAITYAENAKKYGYVLKILPLGGFEAGIETTRSFLPRMYWALPTCTVWVEACESYTKKWNEALKVWSPEPQHDQYSHPADMTRYLAQAEKAGWLTDREKKEPAKPVVPWYAQPSGVRRCA